MVPPVAFSCTVLPTHPGFGVILIVPIGVGLTITVAVIGVPEQPLATGVIVKVTVIGTAPGLINTPLIFPLPLPGIPVTVTVLFLVQLNVVPVTFPVSIIGVMFVFVQMPCEAGVATAFGVGLTNTVAVMAAPGQLFAVGVIVKVTVTGALVGLVKVPEMLPLPLAAMPVTVAVLLRVHAYVVPVTFPVRTIVAIEVAEQIVCAAGVATAFGVGLTRTVAVIGKPTQPLAVGVIVKVTVTGALVVFVKVPEMLPLPLAAMPVTVAVLLRVHAYVVPVTAPVKTMVLIDEAEQMVCAADVAMAVGVGLTSTLMVEVLLHPFKLVTVTVYIPDPAGVMPFMTGFLSADVNPFGPDQANVKLLFPFTLSCKLPP